MTSNHYNARPNDQNNDICLHAKNTICKYAMYTYVHQISQWTEINSDEALYFHNIH